VPLYDYKCTECNHREEVMHRIDESVDVECELCGGEMRKQFSSGHSFRFYVGGGDVTHSKGDWD
jgi:putative FmdB family regulatory protein